MPRVVNDAQLEQAVKDKKLDPRGTREVRKSPSSPTSFKQESPLSDIAKSLGDQGRAMEGAVRDLGVALKSQGGEAAAAIKMLASLIAQNNALVQQMMSNMTSMHKMQPQAEKPSKPKKVTIKVNRTNDRYIDTLEFTTSEDQ